MPSPDTTKQKKGATRAKAPRPPQDHQEPQYGSSNWKRFTDLRVPSGALVQVKRPGVQGLIKEGVIDSFDTLTGIVQTEVIPGAQGLPKVDAKKLLSEHPEKLGEMLDIVDKVVCHVVTQPKILPITKQVWNDETNEFETKQLEDDEYDLDSIYVDSVGSDDKMFIFQFAVGGNSDLEQFRQKSEELVASVQPGEEPELEA